MEKVNNDACGELILQAVLGSVLFMLKHLLSNQQMNGKAKNTNPVWINSVLRRDFFTLSLTMFPFFKNSWAKLKKYWETTDPDWSNC